jgi:hypothetical protein
MLRGADVLAVKKAALFATAVPVPRSVIAVTDIE